MTVYTTNYFNNRHTPIAQGVLTKAYKKMNAVDTYNKLGMIPCPKCGLDLLEREGSETICTTMPCDGILIKKETLKIWAKEQGKEISNGFSSFYECGKCKLASKEHKEHMIENGMLDLVVKHIHLFEN